MKEIGLLLPAIVAVSKLFDLASCPPPPPSHPLGSARDVCDQGLPRPHELLREGETLIKVQAIQVFPGVRCERGE